MLNRTKKMSKIYKEYYTIYTKYEQVNWYMSIIFQIFQKQEGVINTYYCSHEYKRDEITFLVIWMFLFKWGRF